MLVLDLGNLVIVSDHHSLVLEFFPQNSLEVRAESHRNVVHC